MQSNYRLVMRSGPSVGKVYPLDKAEAFVGRDLNNDIVINDPEISRRHARFYNQGNGYILEDLGSTNGTFVNGQRLLGPHVLRPGDMITFGERLSMVFKSSDVDQDATMVSPAARGGYPQATEVQPPEMQQMPRDQEPAYNAPPAPVEVYPSYSGQVPGAYPPEPAPPAARRSPRMWLIIVAILLLLCVCLAVFLFLAPREFWCLFPVWPAGACP